MQFFIRHVGKKIVADSLHGYHMLFADWLRSAKSKQQEISANVGKGKLCRKNQRNLGFIGGNT